MKSRGCLNIFGANKVFPIIYYYMFFFGCTFREIREMRRKLQKHGQPSRYGKLLLWEGVFVKVPLDVGAGWMVPEEEQWDDGAMNPLAKSYGLAMIFFGDES